MTICKICDMPAVTDSVGDINRYGCACRKEGALKETGQRGWSEVEAVWDTWQNSLSDSDISLLRRHRKLVLGIEADRMGRLIKNAHLKKEIQRIRKKIKWLNFSYFIWGILFFVTIILSLASSVISK